MSYVFHKVNFQPFFFFSVAFFLFSVVLGVGPKALHTRGKCSSKGATPSALCSNPFASVSSGCVLNRLGGIVSHLGFPSAEWKI